MSNPNAEVEYRIREVTRYIVTKYERGQRQSDGTMSTCGGRSTGRGEYENANTAYEVAYALCKADHERLGFPIDDPRIQYPRHPDEVLGGSVIGGAADRFPLRSGAMQAGQG